jgi:hypothetical protein
MQRLNPGLPSALENKPSSPVSNANIVKRFTSAPSLRLHLDAGTPARQPEPDHP